MAMVSSSQKSFLSSIPLTSAIHKPKKFRPKHLLRCRSSSEKDVDPSSTSADDNRLARLAIVTLAAGVLTLGSVHDAMAAKSGGRVGGQAFRSAAPRINNPRTNNIYVNPPVAPPLFGGYGYGSPFYGGWGWSPFSFFAPGPSVAVGVGGGPDFFVVLLVLSAVATVVRRFTRPRDDEDDY